MFARIERWVDGVREWRGEYEWSLLAKCDNEKWRWGSRSVGEILDGEVERWWVLERQE